MSVNYVLNEGSVSHPAKRYGGSRKVSRRGISSDLTMGEIALLLSILGIRDKETVFFPDGNASMAYVHGDISLRTCKRVSYRREIKNV